MNKQLVTLLEKMTLDEKIGQLLQLAANRMGVFA